MGLITDFLDGLKGWTKALLPGMFNQGAKDIAASMSARTTEETKVLLEGYKTFINDVMNGYTDEFNKIVPDGITVTPEVAATLQTAAGAAAGIALTTLGAGSTAGEIASLGQVETHSEWLKGLAEWSGLGAVLGATITAPYNAAILRPYKYFYDNRFPTKLPEMKFLFDARARFIISRKDFERLIQLQGYDPRGKLEVDEPKALRHSPDFGEMFQRLSEAPAGYFLLNMAARSGFFDKELFTKLLLDSNYGPEVSEMAIKGFEKAIVKRHMTKFEDESILDFSRGDITMPEFVDRLRMLGYQEDMVTVLKEFWATRKKKARKRAGITILRNSFKAGRIEESEFRKKLVGLGYTIDDIDFMIDEEKAKLAEQQSDIVEGARLSKGELKQAFRVGVIDETTLKKRLLELNYSEEDIAIIIDIEQAVEEPKVHAPGLGLIGQQYKEGIIELDEATAELTALGYAGKDIEDIVALWNVQVTPPAMVAPTLTLGQLNKAYRDGLLPEKDYQGELRARAFNESDVKLLLDMHAPKVKPVKVPTIPTLTTAQLGRLYREGLLPESEFRAELEARKFEPGDIERYIQLYRPAAE